MNKFADCDCFSEMRKYQKLAQETTSGYQLLAKELSNFYRFILTRERDIYVAISKSFDNFTSFINSRLCSFDNYLFMKQCEVLKRVLKLIF